MKPRLRAETVGVIRGFEGREGEVLEILDMLLRMTSENELYTCKVLHVFYAF